MGNEKTIKKVIDYIENNLDIQLNLEEIAKEAGYSKFHLNRVLYSTLAAGTKGKRFALPNV